MVQYQSLVVYKYTDVHVAFLCAVIFLSKQSVTAYEINCTTINRCDPIHCESNEPCTINCFGSSQTNDACTNTELHCTDHYSCTLNCIQGQACWGLKIFCPNDSVCNINAPYGQNFRAMAWIEIYGGNNGILNVRNDVSEGMELGTIICPTNGDCNLYSNNVLNVASWTHIFMDIKVNASLSHHLNITLVGYNNPLLFGMIYCPMSPSTKPSEPNCIIDLSDGNDTTVTNLLDGTEIFTNQYTNLYLRASANTCAKCSVEMHLSCMDHLYLCDAILINDTDDEWLCVNKSKSTQCTTVPPMKYNTSYAATITSFASTAIITTDVVHDSDDTVDSFMKRVFGYFPMWIMAVIVVVCTCAICSFTCFMFSCIVKCVMLRRKKRHKSISNSVPGASTNTHKMTNTLNTTEEPRLPMIEYNANDITTSNVIPVQKMSVQMEGVNKGGILCAKCSTFVNNGKITVQNGMFFCEKCMNENQDDDILNDSDSNRSISDMFGTQKATKGGLSPNKKSFKLQANNKYEHFAGLPDSEKKDKGTKQYGTCLECGCIKIGRVDEEDASFFCDKCWEQYNSDDYDNFVLDTEGNIC